MPLPDRTAFDNDWQETTPLLDRTVEFETPVGDRGRGKRMRMQNGHYALQTPHEGFTGSETFFEVSRWRDAG